MICPTCGHNNISGVDECAECQTSLMQEDPHSAITAAQQIIMTDPISSLDPPAPICVSPETALAEAISSLRKHNVGALLVEDAGGRLVGILTERDVLYKVAGKVRGLSAVPVSQVMTPNPTTLKPTASIAHALHLMALHGFRHIPIVDNESRPIALMSFRGMVQFIGTSIVPAAVR